MKDGGTRTGGMTEIYGQLVGQSNTEQWKDGRTRTDGRTEGFRQVEGQRDMDTVKDGEKKWRTGVIRARRNNGRTEWTERTDGLKI